MNKTLEITPCFQVNGGEIEIVHEAKYRAANIDENLKCNSQVKFLQKKTSQALGCLQYSKQCL